MKKIMAGIVTYNVQLDRLKENLNAIKDQVDEVIIVDNNSNNKECLRVFELDFKVIYNPNNYGIAYALNQMMKYAGDRDYEWVITLDQDSVCPSNYISYAHHIIKNANERVGQIVPILYEDNAGVYCYMLEKPNQNEWQEVTRSITSAAVTNVDAWREVGGFDDDMFIDYVDYDYALKLRKAGYKIIRLNNVVLNHRLGDSNLKNVFFKKIRIANHSAFRKYYISRNMIIFIKRYFNDINVVLEVLRLFKVIFFTIFFESDKKNKLKLIYKGICDGLNYESKKSIHSNSVL